MTTLSARPGALVLALGLALAGCSHVPMNGPTAKDITDDAGDKSPLNFELVDVSPATLEMLRDREDATFHGTFGSEGVPDKLLLGLGDVVTIAIWESASGGLFSGDAGSHNAVIPPQPVAQDGSIVVPYAGKVQVDGRTPQEVQVAIQNALAGKAIEPQVVVSVQSVYNTVAVLGEVTKGGRIPLSGRGDRVLDLIAEAGISNASWGVSTPFYEVVVQLTRNGQTVRVPLKRIVSDPAENIYAHSGDVLTLIHDPQRVIVAGAVGKTIEVPFETDRTVLAQAIAAAGGLTDNRADPTGVFVLRYETGYLAAKLGPASLSAAAAAQVPVIYRFNLQKPDGLFMAEGFRIYDHDLVYVSNAPLTDLEKLTRLFSTLISPAVSISSASP
jgi:polysaccharide export outer membrane protein